MSITFGDVAKLGDRPGSPGVLSKLGDLAGDASLAISLPVADRYRISRFVQLVSRELTTYVRLVGEIGRKYGESRTAPQGFTSFTVRPECRADYEREQADLDEMECEGLAALSPLPLSSYEKIPLTPRELIVLEKFVVLPELG